MSYLLRVDLSTVTSNDVIALLQDASKCYAYAVEGFGTVNPHIHAWLQTSVKKLTFRSRLRALGLKGNGAYSFKEVKEEYPIEYLAYLHKEGGFVSVGIDDNTLLKVREYNDKVKEEIKARKKKRSVMECLKDYVADYVAPLRSKEGGDLLADSSKFSGLVRMAVLNYHIENDILIRKFQIVAYVDTILMSYYKDDNTFKHKWLADVFRDDR